MDDFGVVIACCAEDHFLARGCVASVREFLGDVPICLIYDGRYAGDLAERFGVRVLQRADVRCDLLRERSFGWGLSKMVAFWEAPWPKFLLLDADTIVWRDVLAYGRLDEADVVVDRHFFDIAAAGGVNPYLADFLDQENVQAAPLAALMRQWFFDPALLGHHRPGFAWQRHAYDYFCSGALFARRGVLELDAYLDALDLQQRVPGIFGPGEMGLLNYLVFRAADEGRLRVAHESRLQTLVCRMPDFTEPEHATVVHWSGRPKPRIARADVHSALMTRFRGGDSAHARLEELGAPLPSGTEDATAVPGWLQVLIDTDALLARGFAIERGSLPFEPILRPLVDVARSRVDGPPALERHLLETLAGLAGETLMRELDARRPPGVSLLNAFVDAAAADPATVHFDAFVEDLLRDGLYPLWRRYPALARLVGETVERWVETTRMLLADAPEPIAGVRTGLSDLHHGGRSVSIVTFASGARAVHKPRDLGLESAWADVVQWMNERGAPVPLRAAAVRAPWCEAIEKSPCTSPEAFYAKAGATLCLLYLLGGSDCHHDNVIAAGDDPVVIDLETLLQPDSAASPHPFHASVVRTGLLPRWEVGADGRTSFDLSALGGVAEQTTAWRVPKWEAVNTDAMHRARVPSVLAPGQSATGVEPEEYVEAIVDGFARTYRFVSEQRSAFPLDRFRGLRTRVLLRPTSVYYAVLERANAPDALRSEAARDAELQVLAEAFRDEPVEGWENILAAEVAALRHGDIPHFVVPTDRSALFYRRSGLDAARARLDGMSEDDLAMQVALIRGSMHARVARDAHAAPAAPAASLPERSPGVVTGDPVAAIAEDLVRGALRTKEGPAWIGLVRLAGASRYQLAPAGEHLYDGNGGIALFLAAYAAVENHAAARSLAFEALGPLRTSRPPQGIGGMAGAGSRIYVLTRAADLLGERSLLEDARRAAGAVTSEAIAADRQYDVLTGAAGALLGLLALFERTADADVLGSAIACGEHLLAHRENGAWRAAGERVPLTGFSHGAAGIAYSLVRLHGITKRQAYLDAAIEATAYERGLGAHAARGSWCNGAPGIAAARFASLGEHAPAEWERDAEAALETIEGLLDVDHVCCGNFGRVETLLVAGRRGRAERLAAAALSRGTPRLFLNLARHVITPGFFQGTAGIGYTLLRLRHPQLPSVVLLA